MLQLVQPMLQYVAASNPSVLCQLQSLWLDQGVLWMNQLLQVEVCLVFEIMAEGVLLLDDFLKPVPVILPGLLLSSGCLCSYLLVCHYGPVFHP